MLFPAGPDTTYLGLDSAMWRLLMHPDQLDEVRADTTLSRWAAEEGIRLDPPTAWIPRINTMARTWQGIDLPAGSPMLLGVMAANRDPDVYPDPGRFDIHRRPTGTLPFDAGVHFCRCASGRSRTGHRGAGAGGAPP